MKRVTLGSLISHYFQGQGHDVGGGGGGGTQIF